MKAILCTSYGGPLSVGEVASRPLAAGEVRIRVEACGVNFPDTLIVDGKY